MKVRVLASDLKLLGDKRKYIYPQAGDIVGVDDSSVDLEIEIGNVEPAPKDNKRTKGVKEQKPSKTATLPEEVESEEPDEEEEPKKKPKVVRTVTMTGSKKRKAKAN